jgi:hypothetical protein
MGRACSMDGEKMNAYRILVGKPEGKRPLGRPSRRWVDNIATHLIKTFPGNGSVNTSQHAIIQGILCFLCGLRQTIIETGLSVTSCYVTQRFLQ